jgi:hypothetical protein
MVVVPNFEAVVVDVPELDALVVVPAFAAVVVVPEFDAVVVVPGIGAANRPWPPEVKQQ